MCLHRCTLSAANEDPYCCLDEACDEVVSVDSHIHFLDVIDGR